MASALSIAFSLAVAAPTAVVAQTANADSGGLEEIVVTARKREESLLEVPLAITAVTGDALAEKGVTTFNQLAEAVPSINISNVSAGRSDRSFQQITLRGFVPSSTLSTLTSIFVDGSPVASGTAVMSVFDPARVEVLKGPKRCTSAAIPSLAPSILSRATPTDEFGGMVSLMAGERNNLDLMAAISGPIGERFGFRLAARTFRKDGSYDNGAVAGETLGDQETRTFNVLLQAKPIENLTIKSMVMYTEDDDGPSTQGMISAYEVRSNNGIANYPRLSGNTAGTVIVPGLSNCNLVGLVARHRRCQRPPRRPGARRTRWRIRHPPLYLRRSSLASPGLQPGAEHHRNGTCSHGHWPIRGSASCRRVKAWMATAWCARPGTLT